MIVTFISQCDKNAIKRTRQVLDAFANRIGDFAWQTVITEDGLAMVKRLLARTASKNTAVSCYRLHGKKCSELLWIVGNRSKFNEYGYVPVNSTKRNILHSEWQNDWQYISAIAIMATLAALMHDLGKSTRGFQQKLQAAKLSADPYRHEWLSLKVFLWLIQGCDSDASWLQRLVHIEQFIDENSIDELNNYLKNDTLELGNMEHLPPLAQWLAWLIVTHHRLPPLTQMHLDNDERQAWIYPNKTAAKNFISQLQQPPNQVYAELRAKQHWVKNEGQMTAAQSAFWQFDECVLSSALWQKYVKRWANKAINDVFLGAVMSSGESVVNPILLRLSRLCLMVGDHNYSSLNIDDVRRVATTSPMHLLANTLRKTGAPRQYLDEHLVGVARFAAHFAHHLPIIAEQLPTLQNCHHLRKNTTIARYQWQNYAYQLAQKCQADSQTHGFFGINMASTGCGKTISNARIMYALSNPKQGARFTIALGLRVLTLQTGESLRQDLGLGDDELAVLVGGQQNQQLFEVNQQQNTLANTDAAGSESAQELMDGFVDGKVDYHTLDGLNIDTLLADSKARDLLFSPVVTCTIDHLIGASESRRGGNYIAPMLRLLSGDLILDEPDDFDHHDLPALCRLVHLVGMLGGRVLLSSATLPPDLLAGFFDAYLAGRKLFNQSQNKPTPKIICAWFDEQERGAVSERCDDKAIFLQHHQAFVQKRIQFLQTHPVRRRADILPNDIVYHRDHWRAFYHQFGQIIIDGAQRLHHEHRIYHAKMDKYASVGLVRFANINPLLRTISCLKNVQVAAGVQLHIACYHGRQLLLLRNRLEQTLDTILRRGDDETLFNHASIREAMAKTPARHHIFIVLATAVAEVGRDHDYDWAIVEPSSMRSIIQLAGRVWRHRPNKQANSPNLLILNKNIRYLCGADDAVIFTKPGFEVSRYRLAHHTADKLICRDTLARIDACERIGFINVPKVPETLAQLEHGLLKKWFNQDNPNHVNGFWHTQAAATHLHTHLQQLTPFRHSSKPSDEWVLMPSNQGFDAYLKEDVYQQGLAAAKQQNTKIRAMEFTLTHPQICCWLAFDVQDELQRLQAYLPDKSKQQLALSFCCVSLEQRQEAWYFHPFLGLAAEDLG